MANKIISDKECLSVEQIYNKLYYVTQENHVGSFSNILPTVEEVKQKYQEFVYISNDLNNKSIVPNDKILPSIKCKFGTSPEYAYNNNIIKTLYLYPESYEGDNIFDSITVNEDKLFYLNSSSVLAPTTAGYYIELTPTNEELIKYKYYKVVGLYGVIGGIGLYSPSVYADEILYHANVNESILTIDSISAELVYEVYYSPDVETNLLYLYDNKYYTTWTGVNGGFGTLANGLFTYQTSEGIHYMVINSGSIVTDGYGVFPEPFITSEQTSYVIPKEASITPYTIVITTVPGMSIRNSVVRSGEFIPVCTITSLPTDGQYLLSYTVLENTNSYSLSCSMTVSSSLGNFSLTIELIQFGTLDKVICVPSSLILPSVTGTGSIRTYNSQDAYTYDVSFDWLTITSATSTQLDYSWLENTSAESRLNMISFYYPGSSLRRGRCLVEQLGTNVIQNINYLGISSSSTSDYISFTSTPSNGIYENGANLIFSYGNKENFKRNETLVLTFNVTPTNIINYTPTIWTVSKTETTVTFWKSVDEDTIGSFKLVYDDLIEQPEIYINIKK